jgi:hypothetical protein
MVGAGTSRRRAAFGAAALLVLALADCGKAPREARPPWRDEAERACLRSGVVRESAYVSRGPAIDGPGACGALAPFHVSALLDGRVGLTLPSSLAGRGHKAYAATLTCEMVPALESWMNETVETAAAAVYGQPVVEMHSLGSYSCRRINNGTGTSMISEHAFADAIDVSGFTLADGREVMVRSGWRGAPEDQEFLRSVFVGSCEIFHTVLGPGSDGHHEDHFHLDLMRHAGGHHICRPVIKFTPRTAAPLEAPVQPPVAPGQMQEEPEADDPYALDDTTPTSRGALASREEPVEAAPLASRPPRPTVAAATRPQPVYPTPLPPLRAPQPDDENRAFAAVARKGDRLDRLGPPPGTALARSGAQVQIGSTAIAKDTSRLSSGEASAPQLHSAYAALPPRPPASLPASSLPPRPPAPLPAPSQLSTSRPMAQSTLPPGWSIGPQPVARTQPGRNAPQSPGADDDPTE